VKSPEICDFFIGLHDLYRPVQQDFSPGQGGRSQFRNGLFVRGRFRNGDIQLIHFAIVGKGFVKIFRFAHHQEGQFIGVKIFLSDAPDILSRDVDNPVFGHFQEIFWISIIVESHFPPQNIVRGGKIEDKAVEIRAFCCFHLFILNQGILYSLDFPDDGIDGFPRSF